MFTLEYAKEVNADLKTIYNYIAEDSPTRASAFLGKLEKCILRLKDFPELGHGSKYPELRTLGIKILPFEEYLIFYTVNVKSEKINVVRVLRGSVNYRNLF